MDSEQENCFAILDNEAIGRNISLYRKIRGVKAVEVAEKLGLKEAAYTRYERGEGVITVNMISKIAEYLKVDPLNLLSLPPANIVDNGNNSTNTVVAFHSSNRNAANDEQLKMTLKLIESVTALNEKLISKLS